jgi:hypothetical protein
MTTSKKPRQLLWVDGVNSAVMAYLVLQEDPDAIPIHCDLGASVHPDSHRFINDLEEWYGKPIIRVASTEFVTVDEVFEKRKYLSGIDGAPCTGAMKIVPRMNYQLPSDVHYWGYAADGLDAKRFYNMQERYPLLHQKAPLIEYKMFKKDTHEFLRKHGVKRPVVYDIGMPNGNCLGCVKATSPNYWALIRKHFPDVFARRADQSRRFGARLTRIKGQRIFIDEIPADWPTEVKGNFGGCGFHCPPEDEKREI